MFEQAFKNIDDVLWKDAGCTSELDYTEQTSWLLFLKYLDALETDKATEADGSKYTGGWQDGKPTGKGTVIFSDGSTFTGDWDHGIV